MADFTGIRRKKHNSDWQTYLEEFSTPESYIRSVKAIKAFMRQYNYSPNLELATIADNLYADVGAVAMTLIDLRFTQAQGVIEQRLEANQTAKKR